LGRDKEGGRNRQTSRQSSSQSKLDYTAAQCADYRLVTRIFTFTGHRENWELNDFFCPRRLCVSKVIVLLRETPIGVI